MQRLTCFLPLHVSASAFASRDDLAAALGATVGRRAPAALSPFFYCSKDSSRLSLAGCLKNTRLVSRVTTGVVLGWQCARTACPSLRPCPRRHSSFLWPRTGIYAYCFCLCAHISHVVQTSCRVLVGSAVGNSLCLVVPRGTALLFPPALRELAPFWHRVLDFLGQVCFLLPFVRWACT